MAQSLEKHKKYKVAYKPNDLYWGLGIEHETYIETTYYKEVKSDDIIKNAQRERYSVDYLDVYSKPQWEKAVEGLFDSDKKLRIPFLLNSHSFQKTDIYGEHKTTYEKQPKPNPKFSGTTFFEYLQTQRPDIFREQYEKSFVFDGDTVEFITQDFYKTTTKKVMDELVFIETSFINALNEIPNEGILEDYTPFSIAKENYPFATHLTNPKNISMFNNGTIHINITLPTQLNEKAEIANFELFRAQHQNFARVIQWLSPLLIAVYGTGDPLAKSKCNGETYAAGSQRVAVSRYIGLGTFDTDQMEIGKILTKERKTLSNLNWYNSFYSKTNYKCLEHVGMDFNFNKHWCHGLEFRVLDSLPKDALEKILELMVYLADFSFEYQVENPIKTKIWHTMAEQCVQLGKDYTMEVENQQKLFTIFRINFCEKEPTSIVDCLEQISTHLKKKYENGNCVTRMIKGKESLVPIETTELLPVQKTQWWCC